MFKFLGISLAAAIIVPSVAFASPVPVTRSRHVSYADLDLARTADQVELRHRVWAATSSVCRSVDGDTYTFDEINDCRRAAWLDARKQMRVATEYAMRSGTPVELAGR